MGRRVQAEQSVGEVAVGAERECSLERGRQSVAGLRRACHTPLPPGLHACHEVVATMPRLGPAARQSWDSEESWRLRQGEALEKQSLGICRKQDGTAFQATMPRLQWGEEWESQWLRPLHGRKAGSAGQSWRWLCHLLASFRTRLLPQIAQTQ